MALISKLELLLILPKVIETALFSINSFLINKKYRGIPWKERPQFHRSFLIGMLAWSFYIFLDIFIYTCAGVSMSSTTPNGIYQGYNSQFPSLFFVNILRDIAFASSLLMSWNYLFATFALRFDEEKVKAIFTQNLITLFLMIVLTLIITMGDIIQVSVNNGEILVSGVFNGFAGVSIILNVSIYVLNGLLLFITLRDITREDPSLEFQRKIRFFMLGIVSMGLGHIYWLVLGLLSPILSLNSLFSQFLVYFLGHLFWIISPIFIYLGFGKSPQTPEKEE